VLSFLTHFSDGTYKYFFPNTVSYFR